MATGTDRPLRRDAERNRRRILAAARTAFAEDGLDVTLDEIARRADVGVGTVYRRFPDKQQLIDALFEERIAELAAAAEAALAVEDAWDGLTGFLEAAHMLHAQDRGLREILFRTSHGADRVARTRERLAPLGARLVARAQEQGTLREDLAATDLALVQVMLCGLLDVTSDVEPDVARRMLGLLIDGLQTARDAPSPLAAGALTSDQLDRVMAGPTAPRRRTA